MTWWTTFFVESQEEKKVTLWKPEEYGHLYMTGSSSRVLDIENPDLRRFPKFAKAKSLECLLQWGDVLFIPAFWFHNVYTMEPSTSVNIFWRDLAEPFYEKKDLYGNKDLHLGAKAIKEAESVCNTLAQLPEYYRKFYAAQIVESIKVHCLPAPL